jgi:hypothetical protein
MFLANFLHLVTKIGEKLPNFPNHKTGKKTLIGKNPKLNKVKKQLYK